MPDTSDPAVLWLIITNFAMGAVVVVCFLLVGGAVAREVMGRLRTRHTADDHAFAVPELGLTMADGGERENRPSKKSPRAR